MEAKSFQSELRSWLSSPLLVAVVAALLGSLLIPSITRNWQNHQKALEIQTGLVSDMSQSVSSAVANSRFIAAGLVARPSSQQAWNDLYRDWTTSGASIGARIRAYFGPTVANDWQAYTYALTDFVGLSVPSADRRSQVEEIYAYRNHLGGAKLTRRQWLTLAGNPGSGDFETAYAQLGRALLARQDELVQQVLASHVSGF
jgi:hypothetical protein